MLGLFPHYQSAMTNHSEAFVEDLDPLDVQGTEGDSLSDHSVGIVRDDGRHAGVNGEGIGAETKSS